VGIDNEDLEKEPHSDVLVGEVDIGILCCLKHLPEKGNRMLKHCSSEPNLYWL
jgi:hypothetical protein